MARWFGLVLVCITSCVDRNTSESQGGGSGSGGEAGSAESATGAAAVCPGSSARYLATATTEDSGLGISNAPVTISNCTDEPAYVRQDCCFGATYSLERRNTPDDPWEEATFGVACDCSGPAEPLVIAAGEEIVIDSCPPCVDSVSLCTVGAAWYRWTFSVGPEPDCTDCWDAVTTNEFSWYCEG